MTDTTNPVTISPAEQMREAAAREVQEWQLFFHSGAQAQNEVADSIRALPLPPEPVAVKVKPRVKPLEWREARISSHSPRESAESILGYYEALQWSSGGFGGSVPGELGEDGKEFCGHSSMEEAKAAAQADYERRILSALEGGE